MQVFEERGNRSTWGKTSQKREENQQTHPTYDVESGNRTRAILVRGKCSHHNATTALIQNDGQISTRKRQKSISPSSERMTMGKRSKR